MNAPSVIRSAAGTEQDRYRRAVSQIIGDIQKACGLDLCQIAEGIDVSKETILNAYNKRSDLNAMFLARLGRKYGGAFLNPYMALFNVQASPLEPTSKDVLPLLTIAAHTLACARDPESPGGVIEVPQEKAACLKPFKALHRELGGQIAHIEAVLA